MILKEEWDEWKSNKVTTNFYNMLVKVRDQYVDSLLKGNIEETHKMAEGIGHINALNFVLDIELYEEKDSEK